MSALQPGQVDPAKVEATREIFASSQKEIDKFLVYLSGGGLAISLTLITSVVKIESAIELWLLSLSWILFTLSLVLHFFSFYTSFKSAQNYLLFQKDQINKKHKESESDMFDRFTINLNNFAALTCGSGIILLITFVVINIHKNSNTSKMNEFSIQIFNDTILIKNISNASITIHKDSLHQSNKTIIIQLDKK